MKIMAEYLVNFERFKAACLALKKIGEIKGLSNGETIIVGEVDAAAVL